MLPQLQRLLQAGAGVIVLAAESREAATVVQDLAKLSSKAPLFLLGASIDAELKKTLLQSAAPREVRFVQTLSAAANKSDKKKEFIAHYQKRYHVNLAKDDIPVDPAAHAYDLVWLLAKGVKNSGNPAPESIVRALEQIPRHEGAVKLYSPPFTNQRHDALSEESLGVGIFHK